jgi:multidrug resistance efflux pump
MNNVRPEQIDEITAQLDRLETDRRMMQQQLRSLEVRSPVAGVVGTPARQLLQMAHQFVRKGDPILKIYDFRAVTAQIAVSEKEISEIRVGQPVEMKVRAQPQGVFRGKVTFIATSAAAPPTAAGLTNLSVAPAQVGKSPNVVLVNTEIDNQSQLLKPEMTGQARIDCGEKRVVDIVLWHITRYLRVDSFTW